MKSLYVWVGLWRPLALGGIAGDGWKFPTVNVHFHMLFGGSPLSLVQVACSLGDNCLDLQRQKNKEK